MRVYVPATLTLLARWHAAGAVDAVTAHAVTPALREWYTSGDTDELEYAALGAASEASLQLLADDPSAPRRRVVVAADVGDAVPSADGGRSAVRLPGVVGLDAVVSVHVDDDEAVADVGVAVEALPAAASGDDDARYAVDSADAHDLLWYDVSEVPDLLR